MKVCFIGMCGHSMQVYQTLKKYKDIELCGVAPGSEHEQMRDTFSKEVPFFPDYSNMLDVTHPDLAVISPVFALTGSIITKCAMRGIDVLAEKPIASSLKELKVVKEAVDHSGIRFCAMHFLRYLPSFYFAGNLAKEGAVGQIKMITAQKSYKFGTRPDWFEDRSLYGGTIPWVGIHAIDWISYFTGKQFLSVKSLQSGNPEKVALCQFELEDHIMASVNLDYYRPQSAPTHGDDRIRCVGTQGVLEVIGATVTLINKDGLKDWRPVDSPNLTEEFISGRDCISPDEIFRITAAALAAQESADSGKVVRISEV
ncbi:MAG: Gfo/Idh/MocA family protein [Acutalibacteraceae bacterium]|jgi:predicted dehydrogenase